MASLFDMGSKFAKNPQNFVQNAGSQIQSIAAKSIPAGLDASASRLFQSGLNFGGANIPSLAGGFTAQFAQQDKRVRLALSPGSGPMLYKDPSNSVLSPLASTGGILFPYTPTVSVSHTAQYSSPGLAHTNHAQHSYNASSVDTISVDGYFTANTADEARYVFAVLHFLRSAYKMFYGADALRGTPPPVLRLSGYGPHNYNSVPVVLTSFTEIMPADRDMIEVPLASSPDSATKTMIPTYLPVTMALLPIYSKNQISNFNLQGFARGDLIGNPGRGGGFL